MLPAIRRAEQSSCRNARGPVRFSGEVSDRGKLNSFKEGDWLYTDRLRRD